MPSRSAPVPRWATSSHGDHDDTEASSIERLRSHHTACNHGRGRWFALRCGADAVHDFLAPRFVTTLFMAAAVIGLTTVIA